MSALSSKDDNAVNLSISQEGIESYRKKYSDWRNLSVWREAYIKQIMAGENFEDCNNQTRES